MLGDFLSDGLFFFSNRKEGHLLRGGKWQNGK